MDMMAKYNAAVERWKKRSSELCRKENPDLTKILSRGFWFCIDNPRQQILLSMLNPSVGRVEPKPFEFKRILKRYDPSIKKDFWKPWRECLKEFSDQVAHIDLFPIREGNQNVFKNVVPDDLKAELLRVTQCEVERLHPQLIIHANKTTGFYYGTNPKHPWMGYDLQRVHDPDLDDKGDLYIIKGLLDDEKRIGYGIVQNTKLEGSFLYVCYQQTGIHVQKKTELLIDKRDMDILVKRYTNLIN